jgi:hypothetical protein
MCELMLMLLVNTKQQSSPKTQRLRRRLRSLVNLTRTVSGINNAGHPNLRTSSIRNKTRSSLNSFKAVDEMLLNATATILVRDREVIAMVASGGNVIAIEGRMEEITAGESLQEHISADKSDFHQGGDSSDLPSQISRIATILNAKEDDYNVPVGSYCMVLDSGKSHLKLIHDENKAWEWFLDIP